MQYRVFGLSTLLLAVLSLVSPATAQRPAAGILAGVDSVDAQIALTWGSGIPRLEEATVRSRLQTVFELELRERGIVVTKAAPNYLILSLTVLNNDDGSISYRHDISLYELGLPKRVILDWVLGSVESMDFKRWNTLTKSDSARVSLEMGAVRIRRRRACGPQQPPERARKGNHRNGAGLRQRLHVRSSSALTDSHAAFFSRDRDGQTRRATWDCPRRPAKVAPSWSASGYSTGTA